jgi:hypothetical protein
MSVWLFEEKGSVEIFLYTDAWWVVGLLTISLSHH